MEGHGAEDHGRLEPPCADGSMLPLDFFVLFSSIRLDHRQSGTGELRGRQRVPGCAGLLPQSTRSSCPHGELGHAWARSAMWRPARRPPSDSIDSASRPCRFPRRSTPSTSSCPATPCRSEWRDVEWKGLLRATGSRILGTVCRSGRRTGAEEGRSTRELAACATYSKRTRRRFRRCWRPIFAITWRARWEPRRRASIRSSRCVNLGLDSLIAVEVRNRINADLGMNVPLAKFMQSASINALAAYVAERLLERNAGEVSKSSTACQCGRRAQRRGCHRAPRTHRRTDRRRSRAPLEIARAERSGLMPGVGLDQLTKAQKRALLADRLRNQSRLTASGVALSGGDVPPREERDEGRRSFLDDEVIALASVKNWHAEEQDPYVRYVAPYKGFLYQRLGLDKTFVRGEGCYLFDADGVGYADFIAQFGAVPFGHNPQSIWQALESTRQEAVPNLVITSISAAQGELAAQLLAIAPRGLAHVVFTNSGAESVEAAIKLARCRTGRLGILSARNGFHGLTLAGMSATDTEFFQRGFGAPVPGFELVPFGDLEALEATLAGTTRLLRRVHGRDHSGRVGDPCRAARLSGRCPGPVPPVRRAAHCRRGPDRARPDRETVRLRGGGRDPRHSRACQGTRRRPDADRRLPLHRGAPTPNSSTCGTAPRSQGTRSRAGRRWRPSRKLTKDDQRLVRHVGGDRRSPVGSNCASSRANTRLLVREIRGRGLMLGVELDLRHIAEHQNNLLSLLQEQGLLLYMVVSYLLNVERVRIAPSFTHGTVLRIEPPLIADAPIVRPSDRGAETAAGRAATRRFGRAARAPHGQVRVAACHVDRSARSGACLALRDRGAARHALCLRCACSERRRLPTLRSDASSHLAIRNWKR